MGIAAERDCFEKVIIVDMLWPFSCNFLHPESTGTCSFNKPCTPFLECSVSIKQLNPESSPEQAHICPHGNAVFDASKNTNVLKMIVGVYFFLIFYFNIYVLLNFLHIGLL